MLCCTNYVHSLNTTLHMRFGSILCQSNCSHKDSPASPVNSTKYVHYYIMHVLSLAIELGRSLKAHRSVWIELVSNYYFNDCMQHLNSCVYGGWIGQLTGVFSFEYFKLRLCSLIEYWRFCLQCLLRKFVFFFDIYLIRFIKFQRRFRIC